MAEALKGIGTKGARMTGGDSKPQLDAQGLIDELVLCLADAAHQGVLLAGGPLSPRKTDWLLTQLADELRQAEQLVEALKKQGR